MADPTQESLLDTLAEETGLAIAVLDERGNEVALANNNSICRVLWHSDDFRPRCDEYCGRALAMSAEAGKPVEYRCHAGLECRAVAVKKGSRNLVTIMGRTFSRADDYRNATERAIAGDWRRFPANSFFENVILSGSPTQIERLEQQLLELNKRVVAELPKKAAETPIEPEPGSAEMRLPDPLETSLLNYRLDGDAAAQKGGTDPFETSMVNARLEVPAASPAQDLADREAWRAFIPSLLKVSYKLACRRILEFLARHYEIGSSLWLQLDGAEFEMAATYGEFENQPIRIQIAADDKRIRAAVNDDSPIVFKEAQAQGRKPRVIHLFPVVIGGEVRNALGVVRDDLDLELSSRILKFCRYVASRLEILRLREAVATRERISRIQREFSEQLRNVDAEHFWQTLLGVSAALIGAERASLLVRGPGDRFTVKGVIGAAEDISRDEHLGSRVARTILEQGQPLVVADAVKTSLAPAPERRYRSSSFISYPIILGGRGIAVMSFTDKTGGEAFTRSDVEALDSIAPQIAVVLDRMVLRDKIGEFAQLSVTDPLTGLLNRRYIEERLGEELNRAGRTGDPLSILMLDVDEFKSYNDRFGHPAGDAALRIIGDILARNLRGADVAARYGGEEFSVLLPETTSEEAVAIAERIRKQVEQTEFPKRKVTVSIGICSLSEMITTADRLIDAADKALYRSKNEGRNRINVFDPRLDHLDDAKQ